MKKMRISNSPLTNTIYCGYANKNGTAWLAGKQDITVDTLLAVAEHVVKNGKPVELAVGDELKYRITVKTFKRKLKR